MLAAILIQAIMVHLNLSNINVIYDKSIILVFAESLALSR